MTGLSDFVQGMDWWGLVGLLISAAAALFCITVHELSHGLAAYLLGDPTAKNAGRLSLNPIKHIDPMGLAMMLVAKVAGPSRCRLICVASKSPNKVWPSLRWRGRRPILSWPFWRWRSVPSCFACPAR